MITITLINPPVTIPANAPRAITPPLGLAYIAGVLERDGFEVKILDCVAEGNMRETAAGQGLVCFGLTPEELEMRLSNDPPDVAAICCLSSDQAINAHMVAAACKNLLDRKLIDITTVMGGPHVTAEPRLVMKDLNVDYVVVGEGEQPMLALCQAIRGHTSPDEVPGLAFREATGDISVNRVGTDAIDVDSLEPARHLLKLQRYLFSPAYYGSTLTPHTTVLLSRGCYSKCNYCAVPSIFGSDMRKRNPQNILDEIRYLVDEYAIRDLELVGDNLLHDREWAEEWMQGLIDSRLRVHKRQVKWSPMSGLSLHNLDRDMADLMVKSGLRKIFLDITTGDSWPFERYWRRPGSLEEVERVVKFFRKQRIYTGGLFMVGAPGETREIMRTTVAYAFSLGLNELHFHVLTPFPGTPVWDQCKTEGFFEFVPEAEDLLRDNGYIYTSEFTSEQAVWQRDWARVQENMRQSIFHPWRIAGSGLGFAYETLFHPFRAGGRVWRFLKLAAGVSAPVQTQEEVF